MENDNKMRCTYCGKEIPEGEKIFIYPGYIYRCCSIQCLANTMIPNYCVKRSTGYEEEED